MSLSKDKDRMSVRMDVNTCDAPNRGRRLWKGTP